MSYETRYLSIVVHDDIPSLDVGMKTRIRLAIEQKLTSKPEIFGIPLRQSLKGHRKLRVGDYRVAFRIEKNVVLILAILHRSIVYEHVEDRIK